MRIFAPIVFVLVAAAARAGDVEGCRDLKLLPRLEGCVIAECSAKQHESFDTPEGSAGPLDASVNTLTYSCPASMDLQRVKTELDAGVHKAGFLNIAEDKSDPANPVVTARKSSQWVRWTASSEAGVTTYSLTVASGSSDKFKAEACASSPVLSPLKQCEVLECASKAEDSVAMRTAQKEQTSLTGAVQTITLACPLLRPEQTFSTLESELIEGRIRDSVQRARASRKERMDDRAGREALGGDGECSGWRIRRLRADFGSVGGSINGCKARAKVRARAPHTRDRSRANAQV